MGAECRVSHLAETIKKFEMHKIMLWNFWNIYLYQSYGCDVMYGRISVLFICYQALYSKMQGDG
jgi:hypothetical protein